MSIAFWMAAGGGSFILLGTFVLIGDQWQWFRRSFNRMFRQLDYMEKGWQKLCDNTNTIGSLSSEDQGFKQILNIIVSRRPKQNPAGISCIRCGSYMGIGSGKNSIQLNHVQLYADDGSSPIAVATQETVDNWIHSARFRKVCRFGFGVIAIGVLLELASLVIHELFY